MSRCGDCGGYGVVISYEGWPVACTCDWATEANYRSRLSRAGFRVFFDTSFDGWVVYKVLEHCVDGSPDIADEPSWRGRSLACAVVDLVGVAA